MPALILLSNINLLPKSFSKRTFVAAIVMAYNVSVVLASDIASTTRGLRDKGSALAATTLAETLFDFHVAILA